MALIRATDQNTFVVDRGVIGKLSFRSQEICWSIGESKSSNKSYRSQDFCWSIGESVSSDKTYRSLDICYRYGGQWAFDYLCRLRKCRRLDTGWLMQLLHHNQPQLILSCLYLTYFSHGLYFSSQQQLPFILVSINKYN